MYREIYFLLFLFIFLLFLIHFVARLNILKMLWLLKSEILEHIYIKTMQLNTVVCGAHILKRKKM
jgi:hypothetical protein